MSSSDRERERLQRLRERQLQDRAPGPTVKVRWKKTPPQHEPWLTLFWAALPGRAKGALIGFLLGMVFSVVLGIVAPPPWGMICGTLVFLAAIVVGMIIGRVTDQGSLVDRR